MISATAPTRARPCPLAEKFASPILDGQGPPVRTRWLAPDAASHADLAACVHKAQSAQAPAHGADPPDAEAQDGKRTMNPAYDPRSDAGRRMILEDSFLLLASGGLLLLIVLAEPWLLSRWPFRWASCWAGSICSCRRARGGLVLSALWSVPRAVASCRPSSR